MPPHALPPVIASQRVLDLLARLHAESLAQEDSVQFKLFYLWRAFQYYAGMARWSEGLDNFTRDKFVALDQDKCEAIYLLARSMNALNIVEAGTSFGVSTMYLSLAVYQNAKIQAATTGEAVKAAVIATEKEPTKAARAREHWNMAGEEVERYIDLREGDLLETLDPARTDEFGGLPEKIDILLLDIWTPLALPTLKLVQPNLRRGALIIADNTTRVRNLYEDLLNYIHDESNGFRSTTVPYAGGFEVIVYLPGEN
jgi:predicted O-methyltransferase YrrM